MRELRRYFSAVGSHWGMLLTGTVISLAGLLYAQYGSADRIPNWIFWTIAGACLLVACFLAWRDEHRARVKGENHTPSLDYQAVEKLVEAGREIADLRAQVSNLKAQGAPGPQLFVHAYQKCDLSTSSTSILDLVNLSVDIEPDTPFLVMCDVYKAYRQRNAWLGLKLNDICVNRGDGEHVIEGDTNAHIRWQIGSINEKQMRQVVMEYPRESIHGQFGADGKAAENIKTISVYGRTDDGGMTLRNVYVYV